MAPKTKPVLPAEDSRKLRILNAVAAVVHLVSAAAIFALTEQDAVSPVYVFKANEHRGNATLYGPAFEHMGSAKVGYLAGVFLLLAAIDHGAIATVLRRTYEAQLVQSTNYFRWAEYAFSASVMHVMIAMLAGVMSLQLLLAIAGLTAATMMFGLLQELINTKRQGRPERKSFAAFWIGCISHLVCWTVILITFHRSAASGKAPAFVYVVMVGLFQTDAAFAVNMYLQQRELWRWRRYLFGEYGFIVLSLTAKLLLAWTNFGGTRSFKS